MKKVMKSTLSRSINGAHRRRFTAQALAQESIPCSQCTKRFSTRTSLATHIESRHPSLLSGPTSIFHSTNIRFGRTSSRSTIIQEDVRYDDTFFHEDASERDDTLSLETSAVKCPGCGDMLSSEASLASHLAAMPTDHVSFEEHRSLPSSNNDWLSSGAFSGIARLSEYPLGHATSVTAAEKIRSSQILRATNRGREGTPWKSANTRASAYTGALSRNDAPSCIFTSLHQDGDPRSVKDERFPLDAEPGEELAHLRMSLNSVLSPCDAASKPKRPSFNAREGTYVSKHNHTRVSNLSSDGHLSGETNSAVVHAWNAGHGATQVFSKSSTDLFTPRVYLCGITRTPFGPQYKAKVTVILLVARSAASDAWARKHCTPLDLEENPLLKVNTSPSGGRMWTAATHIQVPEEPHGHDIVAGVQASAAGNVPRELKIVVAIADDLPMSDVSHEWSTSFKAQYSNASLSQDAARSSRLHGDLLDKLEADAATTYKALADCFECNVCGKHFALLAALELHSSRGTCTRPHECRVCSTRFSSQGDLQRHMTRHSLERAQFTCDVCGDVFVDKASYENHMATTGTSHSSDERQGNISLDENDLSERVFSSHQQVLHNSLNHSTTTRNGHLIATSRQVLGKRSTTSLHDGVALLRADAPACAHFSVMPMSEGARPVSTYIPSATEPGEVCWNIDLDASVTLLEPLSTGSHRLYLAACVLESGRKSTGARVTVLVAPERHFEWANEHCLALRWFDNPIVRFDEHGKLRIATRMRLPMVDSSKTHNERDIKLRVIFAFAEGISFDARSNPSWHQGFRLYQHNGVCLCPICGDGFNTNAELISHELDKHCGVAWDCADCSANFASQRTLLDHIKAIHSGSPWECPSCSKTFVHRNSLKQHEESVHNSGAPYICSECSASYAQVQSLRRHQKRMHGDADAGSFLELS